MKIISRIAAIAFALFAASYATSASAAAQRIQCPLSSVRAEITTPMPSGWWNTPNIGNLTGTRIANIGGTPTLMCGYSVFGTLVYVMHQAPAGATCSNDPRGFTCTTPGVVVPLPPLSPLIPVPIPTPIPAPAPTGPIHKKGSLNLQQSYSMDLDNGTIGSAGADIWFRAFTDTERYLIPQNGASIAIAGDHSIGKGGCQSLHRYTTTQIPVVNFTRDLYVCVKTNEGRYSQFNVVKPAGRSPGKIKLTFVTWN